MHKNIEQRGMSYKETANQYNNESDFSKISDCWRLMESSKLHFELNLTKKT